MINTRHYTFFKYYFFPVNLSGHLKPQALMQQLQYISFLCSFLLLPCLVTCCKNPSCLPRRGALSSCWPAAERQAMLSGVQETVLSRRGSSLGLCSRSHPLAHLPFKMPLPFTRTEERMVRHKPLFLSYKINSVINKCMHLFIYSINTYGAPPMGQGLS